jgi:hypothetical protein
MNPTRPKPARVLSYVINHVLGIREWRALMEICHAGYVGERRLPAIRALATTYGARVPVVLAACGFLRDANTGRYVDTADTVGCTRTALLPKESDVRSAYALWRWLANEGCELIAE